MQRQHEWLTQCKNPYCGGTCVICCCGVCKVCGCLEGATTSECPGVAATNEQTQAVYEGRLDFVDGQWVEQCSPHSPKYRC